VSPGDKITCAVYLDNGSTFVVRARFQEQRATLYTSGAVSAEIDSFVCDCVERDEGATWIRGWPDLDSEEVAALLAAFAFAGGESSKLYGINDDDDEDYWWDTSYYSSGRGAPVHRLVLVERWRA